MIVSVGIEVSRVSNGSTALDTIDRVTDVCAGRKDEGGFDDIKSNIPGLDRRSCSSSQELGKNAVEGVGVNEPVKVNVKDTSVPAPLDVTLRPECQCKVTIQSYTDALVPRPTECLCFIW